MTPDRILLAVLLLFLVAAVAVLRGQVRDFRRRPDRLVAVRSETTYVRIRGGAR